MRYTGPRVKKARRLGLAFSPKDAKILQKRPFPPGQHGQSRGRLSEVGLQLREKQKAKFNYGLQERQFKRYFKAALKQPGVTGDSLLKLLEKRLDNVVYRLGFAETRPQARQLVSHGFFLVNGQRINIPSLSVKVGDIVKFKENKFKTGYVEKLREKIKNYKAPEWVEVNLQELTGKVLSEPSIEEIARDINTQLIVEHYSRT